MILAFCVGLAGCASPKVSTNGLMNFQKVEDGIYRGGQPTSKDSWAYLKSLGIKTVIKLDLAAEGSDEEAGTLDMAVVDASGPPSNASDFLKAPKPEKIKLALDKLKNKSLRPVYVHCLHGEDRTGLIVGLYRVLNNGYTKEQAFKEMLDNGFHTSLHGLNEVWEKFDGKTLPVGETQ
jgi:protein tyrosine/serine phosphatase